jgi:hypothetical protein
MFDSACNLCVAVPLCMLDSACNLCVAVPLCMLGSACNLCVAVPLCMMGSAYNLRSAVVSLSMCMRMFYSSHSGQRESATKRAVAAHTLTPCWYPLYRVLQHTDIAHPHTCTHTPTMNYQPQ